MFDIYRNKFPKFIYQSTDIIKPKTLSFKEQLKISDHVGKLYLSSTNQNKLIPSEYIFIPVILSQFEFITISPSTNINVSIILRDGVETVPKCVKKIFFIAICVKETNLSIEYITLILGSLDTSSDKWLHANIMNEIGGMKKILKISDIDEPKLPKVEDQEPEVSPIIPSEVIEELESETESETEIEDSLPIVEKEEEIIEDFSNDSISSMTYQTNTIYIGPHKLVHLYIPEDDCKINPNSHFQLYLFQNTWIPTITNIITEFKDNKNGAMSEKLLKSLFFSMGCFNRESISSQQIFIHLIFRALLSYQSEKVYNMILWIYQNIIDNWIDSIFRLQFLIGDNIIEDKKCVYNRDISFMSSSDEEIEDELDIVNDLIDIKTSINSKKKELMDNIIVPRIKGLYDIMMKQIDHWNNQKPNYFSTYFNTLLQHWKE